MINGHSFDGEGRCIYCEIAAHNAHKQTCHYLTEERNTRGEASTQVA